MTMLARTSGWLGALILCLATTANGQTLISNLANATNGGYGGSPDSSDNMRTGTAPMTVTRVDVAWQTGFAGVNRVAFYTDNAGLPSTTQVGGFFTNPNPTVGGTTMSYNGSVTLAANTTYWMVVEIVDGSNVAFTFTNTFTAAASTGGATMPAGSSFGNHAVAGSWNPDPAQLKFALVGAIGAPGAPLAAPTLQEWALAILALLMAVIAAQRLRRQPLRRSVRAPR